MYISPKTLDPSVKPLATEASFLQRNPYEGHYSRTLPYAWDLLKIIGALDPLRTQQKVPGSLDPLRNSYSRTLWLCTRGGEKVNWAMAGRSLDKLEKIRKVVRALGFECRLSVNLRRVLRGFSVKVRASGKISMSFAIGVV